METVTGYETSFIFNRLYYNGKHWYITNSSLKRSKITYDVDSVFVNNTNFASSKHFVLNFYVSPTPKSSFSYLLQVNGKLVKSLISNLEVNTINIDEDKIKEEFLLFN